MDNLSYPKEKIKIVLLENIHAAAIANFESDGFRVTTVDHAPDEEELLELAHDAHIIGVRSRARLTPTFMAAAKRLLSVGCFSVGTNAVLPELCQKSGIPVFNGAFGSTRSVAEMTIGLMIMLVRRTFEKSCHVHEGKWPKSAAGSTEVLGKTLGIIGYGHIGSQVSVLAEAIGMRIVYYDISERLPLGTAHAVRSLDELLSRSDIVTLHVPETELTIALIGDAQLQRMKRGAVLINASRGKVVDLLAVKQYLESGFLRGAAIDVFPVEPAANNIPFVSPLQGVSNVILTPHVGGSTEEAQGRIGREVSDRLIAFINSGIIRGSVNFPDVNVALVPGTHRILHMHENRPGVLAAVNQIFSDRSVNIQGQSLTTAGSVGYLVIDLDKQVSQTVMNDLKKLDATIRARLLF